MASGHKGNCLLGSQGTQPPEVKGSAGRCRRASLGPSEWAYPTTPWGPQQVTRPWSQDSRGTPTGGSAEMRREPPPSWPSASSWRATLGHDPGPVRRDDQPDASPGSQRPASAVTGSATSLHVSLVVPKRSGKVEARMKSVDSNSLVNSVQRWYSVAAASSVVPAPADLAGLPGPETAKPREQWHAPNAAALWTHWATLENSAARAEQRRQRGYSLSWSGPDRWCCSQQIQRRCRLNCPRGQRKHCGGRCCQRRARGQPPSWHLCHDSQ
mmetsp:Transcript_55933/g.121058  ORF Transcript_55933/g.121058 Transcript_55933/m.121058 type:complete len:269 (-) Transcript_55933:1482-2288(-)